MANEPMTEAQIDVVVEAVKDHVRELDEVYAELILAHAYFEVCATIALYRGKRSREEIKAHVIASLDAFLEGNPFTASRTH